MSEIEGRADADEAESQLALGTAFVLAGQAAFVLCGYFLHFYMSRAIGPVAFGTYGVVMDVLTWTQNALNNGVPWAVRRFLPADPEASATILHQGLRWQLIAGVALYAASMLLSPWFGQMVSDDAIAFHLRLALIDMLPMALYTFYRGALNGLRLFAAQGASLVAYAVAKLVFSALLVRAGFSLRGALVGNTFGTLVGWLFSYWLLRRWGGMAGRTGARAPEQFPQHYDGRQLLGFALPTVVFTLASTFLTSVGLVGVKAVVQSDLQVAYFSAAKNLSTAPTLLLVTFSWTLFPHLAGSIAAGDRALTRTYIRSAVRYLSWVLVPGIALVLATSPRLLATVYPEEFAAGAPALNLLIISTGLYSLFMVLGNAILAEGRVLLGLAIPCALVPVSVLATWLLTQLLGPIGAAAAAVLSTGAAVGVSAYYVLPRFAVDLDWASIGRVTVASLVIYLAARIQVPSGMRLMAYYVVLGSTYLGLLALLGEITVHEARQWQAGLSAAVHRWRIWRRV